MEQHIIGHESICSYLKARIEQGRLSHAYFFVGPAHIGKMTIARWFIDALHPSERIFMPADGETSAITIEDIRALRNRMSRSTDDGGYRVVCISGVDVLTAQAGNALLKCVEEPPKHTIFILCADNEEGVLKTLVSRCAVIRFSLVRFDILSAALVKRECADADVIARLSAGRPGYAIRLMEHPLYRAECERAWETLKKCETGAAWYRFVCVSELDAANVLDMAEMYAHRRLRECIEGRIPAEQSRTATVFLASLTAQTAALRSTSVLQASKSFLYRLLSPAP
ncbi:hypothetical protein HY732_00520 [Candidatus Uhrbacteria bacterium]|nr:hypothetical protein [Candidatus Uhrbacteria bacterium]